MIALSIRQPWAWLIVNGFKDIENRTWKFEPKFRGKLLIHASASMTRDEYEDCLNTCHEISKIQPFPYGTKLPAFEDLQRGGIVGIANLTEVVRKSESPWFFGTLGFVLKDPSPLPFMACKGQLGFFDVDYHRQEAA